MFQSFRDGAFDLYLMNEDGSGVARLIESGLSPELRPRKDMPAWSPDYTRIAYVVSGSDSYGIAVVGADGKGNRLVFEGGELRGISSPSWSPDGTQIAFFAYNVGEVPAQEVNREVYVLDVESGQHSNVTQDAASDLEPSWSPDGALLLFASSRDPTGLFAMSPDGTNVRWLAQGGGAVWSPGGSRIAYVLGGDIYVMNADGSGQTRLTSSPGQDIGPDWSPDGSKIVFDSDRDGNEEIYVMNADGSGQTRLTNDPGFDVNPSW